MGPLSWLGIGCGGLVGLVSRSRPSARRSAAGPRVAAPRPDHLRAARPRAATRPRPPRSRQATSIRGLAQHDLRPQLRPHGERLHVRRELPTSRESPPGRCLASVTSAGASASMSNASPRRHASSASPLITDLLSAPHRDPAHAGSLAGRYGARMLPASGLVSSPWRVPSATIQQTACRMSGSSFRAGIAAGRSAGPPRARSMATQRSSACGFKVRPACAADDATPSSTCSDACSVCRRSLISPSRPCWASRAAMIAAGLVARCGGRYRWRNSTAAAPSTLRSPIAISAMSSAVTPFVSCSSRGALTHAAVHSIALRSLLRA